MTDKQQTKYLAGQIVHVRVRVFIHGPDHDDEVAVRSLSGRGDVAWVKRADIVSVEPDPLKVGDLVMARSGPRSSWRILAIDSDWSWCTKDGTFCTFRLDELVRA